MSAQQRLSKLEADERRELIHQIESLENRLRARMTERELFVVNTILTMCDDDLREADDNDEQDAIIFERRQSATITQLRTDVAALQWAHAEFDDYETSDQNIT